MKKLVILFGLISQFTFAQKWTVISLSDSISISFPKTPETTQNGIKTVSQLFTEDYAFNTVKTDVTNHPGLSKMKENLDGFYTGVIKGSLAAIADGKLISEKEIIICGYKGKEIEFTMDYDQKDDVKGTRQIVLISNCLYVIEIWNLNNLDYKKTRQKFFKSFTLTKP